MTTVDDILQLIEPSDRLRIVKDGKDLFVGYVGAYKLDSEKQCRNCGTRTGRNAGLHHR